ncbi:hypothetical protein DZA16_16215 [Pseudomonas aeruginosa]|uniref:hypothetical protein n=1 Tax=Pseudomonas aeruginosa TaxID=287 RepID=UPI000F831253|nr:hypothetical protein [Pseudomonas aeruginosa]RTX11493.1 hypothetical protein DZA16_16215 [Pseudomonas aeruginosa]
MNELKKITKKEIVYSSNYLSYTKSMLHLPIFTVSNENSDDLYVLKIDKLLGFKNIEFNFPKLSIKSDFMIFSYVLKLFYSNCDSEKNIFEIDFDMNDFFDFYNVKRNNRSSYTKTMTESIKRLSKINLSFERNDKTYICNFISSATIDNKNERKFQITLGKNFLNFFEHDPDLIFNINIENLMKLEKDFSKILYLYYITNLHKLSKENVASFDKEEIFTRLQSLSVDKRKLQMIREANEELIKNGFIKSYSFSKSGNRVTKINIEYFSKKKEEQKEDKSSRPKLFK